MPIHINLGVVVLLSMFFTYNEKKGPLGSESHSENLMYIMNV